MQQELKGKVAIVTGPTRKRGLGRAIALCLARAGADVMVTGSGVRKSAGALPSDERDGGWTAGGGSGAEDSCEARWSRAGEDIGASL